MVLCKCCACALLSQIIAIGVLVGIVLSGYVSYENWLKPWGEEQLEKVSSISVPSVSGLSCRECPGVNMEWPMTNMSNYTNFQVNLMNTGGKFVTNVMTTSIAAAGGTMLFSIITSVISSASASQSVQGGFFETFHLIGHAQFITLLGTLNLEGPPAFFLQFTNKLAWTNLHILPGGESKFSTISKSALNSTSTSSTNGQVSTRLLSNLSHDPNVKGVERYALLVGVEPKNLFYLTCLSLAVVCGCIIALYVIVKGLLAFFQKQDTEFGKTIDRRVVWVIIQLLLLVQYAIAMTASFQIYYSLQTDSATSGLILALIMLASTCVGLVLFGVVKISRHREELEDLGTIDHEKKPFNHKYGAYYQDFTKENCYFFVAKTLLDISCGVVVGVVHQVMIQIAILIGLNVIFLIYTLVREPYLIRLFYYVGVVTGYLRIILLLLTIIEAYPTTFPQGTRDIVAMIIIGVNAALFLCILIRQIYVIFNMVVKWCKNKKANDEEMTDGIPLRTMPNSCQPNTSNVADTYESTYANRVAPQASVYEHHLTIHDHIYDQEFKEQTVPAVTFTSPANNRSSAAAPVGTIGMNYQEEKSQWDLYTKDVDIDSPSLGGIVSPTQIHDYHRTSSVGAHSEGGAFVEQINNGDDEKEEATSPLASRGSISSTSNTSTSSKKDRRKSRRRKSLQKKNPLKPKT